ncbi:MAG TPA: TPM domain-containing protein [Candidatus Cybelea sp.]|nr:TPM domain-containing protein [Candidatus Cybelea sp.]
MSGRHALLLVAVAALGWPGATAAADFKVPPTPDHYVTDNAGALSSEARTSVENELHAYETATGHQIVVWIGQTTGDVPLETWTGDTARQWKIGRRGHDDGAVLFLFMQDHKVRIEVGYGLESALTDADAHRIISDVIVPRMRAGDPNAAVTSGVAAMLATITPSYKGATYPPEAAATTDNGNGGAIAVFLFAIVGLFGAFLIFIVVMQVVSAIRYGYLVLREGPGLAKKEMKHWPAWASGAIIGGSSSGFGGGDFGGGFSGGGGDFGGGGASGGW